MSVVTWLHLSDWHEGPHGYDRSRVGRRLLDDVRDRQREIDERLANIDFVVFNGDASFSGSAREFRSVEKRLFRPLLELLKLTPDALFFVPGNHDLDRQVGLCKHFH